MFVSQFVYCIISDHTDGTAVQRATNNVDACTQCAYLFFKIVEIAHLHQGDERFSVQYIKTWQSLYFHKPVY